MTTTTTTRVRLLFHAASTMALLLCAGAPAQRTPGPRPPSQPQVRMTAMTATVRVVDGVATTTLRQVLHNDGARPAEATWILPLPQDAVADRFRMTVDGTEMAGEVLGATEARTVYESIVRQRRDPGLLEYMGRGCLRARIFPIPAHGDVKVEVGFRQVLPELGGLWRWTFPLDAAGLPGRPPEQIALDLMIDSKRPLRNVFSPTAGMHVVKKDDHQARASYEAGAGRQPGQQLAVFYGLSEQEFGLDLLSYKKGGEQDGYFLMLISPKRDWDDQQVLKKSISFVLDTSGSMQGKKIEQAKGALKFFLQSLNADDEFNVVPFSTEPVPFFPGAVSATAENIAAANEKIGAIEARGGTNIAGALEAGIPNPGGGDDRVRMTVFVTDGLPTVGTTDVEQILAAARQRHGGKTRVFVFGVGDDVNTRLLDTIAADSGGTRDYVRTGEDIEEKTGALFTNLSHPVMSDLELSFDGVEVSRTVPAKLPDLFKGGRLVVVGRYDGAGSRAIRLAGTVMGKRREYVYEGTFAAEPREDYGFVPSLWAERRVAVLLDAIRLSGPAGELLDEVRRLGREFQIVTPYTSHLILEEGLKLAGGGGTAPGRRYGGPGDSTPPAGGAAWGALRSTGPATPGTGPATPGSAAGPSTGGPAGPATPPGEVRARTENLFVATVPDLDQIAARLRDAGVLPKDASPEQLRQLASEVARELRDAQAGLDGLGRQESGQQAVDDSAYLAFLLRSGDATVSSDQFSMGTGKTTEGRPDGKLGLLGLFTRKVKDKVFLLRDGIWVDRMYDAADEKSAGEKSEKTERKKTIVEAYSDEYFALLKAKPALQPYLAFSSRILVVLDDEVFEVRPPKSEGGGD